MSVIGVWPQVQDRERAVRAGLDAQRALANEAAGDLAVDAAKAYWGVKSARELSGMLDDGIDEIGKAVERMDERGGNLDGARKRFKDLLAKDPGNLSGLIALAQFEARHGASPDVVVGLLKDARRKLYGLLAEE